MHPLDLAKTRLQLGKNHYSSLTDVFKQTFRHEGVKGFYKGILPPIMAAAPKRGVKFFTFEKYNQLLATDRLPIWSTICLAGFGSGVTEALAITPFDVIKIRLQIDKSSFTECTKSTSALAREIVRKHGLFRKGLYCGFSAMCYREGLWNMFYFGIYYNVKHLIPDEKLHPGNNIAVRLFLGFCSGTIATILTIPLDVAKSRIQSIAPADPLQRYHSPWQTIQLIRKEEGVSALSRGLIPKVMRLGPGGAVMLYVYDKSYEWLISST